MIFNCNRTETDRRRESLDEYLVRTILGSEFICRDYEICKSSHGGAYYEGQLHHIGQCYDMLVNNVPLRVMIVGQEYGHLPAHVSLEHRHQMIMSSGLECRFKAEPGREARNPHMKGTTNVLRLMFDIPLGSDYDSELITIDGRPEHLFEAFALVNYLLCSAVSDETKTRGLSTPEMKKNCLKHFRAALEILEPSVVIVQGKSFWPSVRNAFDSVISETPTLYQATLRSFRTHIAVFTHPSARFPNNWGANDHTPYLLGTVAPTVMEIRSRLLGNN